MTRLPANSPKPKVSGRLIHNGGKTASIGLSRAACGLSANQAARGYSGGFALYLLPRRAPSVRPSQVTACRSPPTSRRNRLSGGKARVGDFSEEARSRAYRDSRRFLTSVSHAEPELLVSNRSCQYLISARIVSWVVGIGSVRVYFSAIKRLLSTVVRYL